MREGRKSRPGRQRETDGEAEAKDGWPLPSPRAQNTCFPSHYPPAGLPGHRQLSPLPPTTQSGKLKFQRLGHGDSSWGCWAGSTPNAWTATTIPAIPTWPRAAKGEGDG